MGLLDNLASEEIAFPLSCSAWRAVLGASKTSRDLILPAGEEIRYVPSSCKAKHARTPCVTASLLAGLEIRL